VYYFWAGLMVTAVQHLSIIFEGREEQKREKERERNTGKRLWENTKCVRNTRKQQNMKITHISLKSTKVMNTKSSFNTYVQITFIFQTNALANVSTLQTNALNLH
jgi:hypothetical protein